ncbi:unnamed protein product [Mytilus coruscus]|uniref:SMB domain-containing protein n=1 Tax=Mytilus coruscus TaxID=42192 RepID=A0A6J8EW74_MYTCO|nr:unnamed protein product [Mytilus coruscus]
MLINVETLRRLSNGQDVNLTHIDDIYAGFCKTTKCYYDKFGTSLDRNILHNNSTGCNCSCDISCFISGICCPKIFFDYTTCTETNILSSSPEQRHTIPILMIDRCPNISDYKLKKGCEISSDLETQLQNTPVTSMKSGHTFRNIYCLMCYNIYKVSLNIHQTWTLNTKCKEALNFNFLPSYLAVIKHALMKHCDIFFESYPSITKQCQVNLGRRDIIISTCNVSGTWTTYDHNIEFACQIYDNRFYSFKNVFCFICNPLPENVIFESKVKEHCNESCNRTDILNNSCTDKRMLSVYDMDVEHKCKNMLHTECNLPIIKYFCGLYIRIKMYNGGSNSDYMVPFRAVFDISKYSNNFEQIPTTNKCNEKQVVDSKKNVCRDIMCYPGRILMKTGCEPIFKITRDLAFILSLGMTTELVHDINKPLSFLKLVRGRFTVYLKRILNIQWANVTVTSSVFLANSICEEKITRQNGTKLNITLYNKFVIRDYVDRSSLEEKLISLQNGYFGAIYGSKKYNFKLFKNVEALSAESHISTLRYLQRCVLKTITQTKDSYVYSHVNKLLVCKQIEFETTEFNMRSSKLIVLSTKIELDYDEYAIMSSGKARICLETFRKMFTKDKPERINVWGIIEMTCACTSLIKKPSDMSVTSAS